MMTAITQESPRTHPLLDMMLLYFDHFRETKESNEELDNLNFHRQFGLTLSVPDHWPLLDSIQNIIRHSVDSELRRVGGDGTVVIYPSSRIYRDLYDNEQDITYFSWQEFYVAMDRAGKDARELKRFRHLLENANLIIFCGAPIGIPEIVDQVRGFCEGCLIVLE